MSIGIPSPVLYSKLKRLERDVDFLAGRVPHAEWKDVQDIVRAGLASRVFSVGDQFAATYDGVETLWDIIGIDHDIPTDKQHKHSMTIQAHDCLLNCQFDAPEALYYAEVELPAGVQVFTLDSGVGYTFTTSQPVPVGGQVDVATWGDGDYVPATITTYAADRTTAIESGLAVSIAASGEDTMTNLNTRARARYGSNNYLQSNIREWLNSEDAQYIWTPQTVYDRPSTAAPYNGGGFLSRLDPELVAVLGAVDKRVTKATYDGGGQDLFSDKVFLLSRVETYNGGEGATTGETPYDYYAAMAPAPTAGELAARIKYLSGSARTWWLRSPYPGYTHSPRLVYAAGQLSSACAYGSYGAAPACCIV